MGILCKTQHAFYEAVLLNNSYTRRKNKSVCTNGSCRRANDSKHSSKSTTGWLNKETIKMLQLSGQSKDLSLTEMMWLDRKRAVDI